MIGKWHCGHLPWFSPTRVGWDEFFGNFGGAIDYFSKVDLEGRYDLYEGEVEHQDLRYYTEILTEKAALFVRQRRSDPWMLNLNFTTPHWPWEGPGDKTVSSIGCGGVWSSAAPTGARPGTPRQDAANS